KKKIAGGNGELIIAGRTRSNDGDVSGNHGDWDFLLLRTDSAGQLLGQWCYGGADAERSNTIKRAATERFIMGGYASSNDGDVSSTNGDLDVWVIEVDDTGSIQWEQSWGGTSMESTEGIDIAADGGIVVPAWSLSGDLDNTCQLGTGDWWLSKLDAAGTLSWRSCVGGTAEEIPYDVVALPDTGFVVAGQTFSADGDVQSHIAWQDAWLVRFDATGNIAWERCVGGSMMEEFHGLEATPDGGYIACGNTSSNDVDVSGNHGGYDGWVAKFGPDALGIARPAVSPASVRFDTWSGLLSIVLPEAERRVGVKLLDAHGRVVSATAFSGREHQLDLGDRASGVYLVRLERSGQVEHHRVLRL
ncbi:MAG: T9SS type A sorting domain-containing protein, partial [Flavobacteriales bacterium]|nr:T9SS type A sorting domain-containing protein [Flavobacteriales bacterium]